MAPRNFKATDSAGNIHTIFAESHTEDSRMMGDESDIEIVERFFLVTGRALKLRPDGTYASADGSLVFVPVK